MDKLEIRPQSSVRADPLGGYKETELGLLPEEWDVTHLHRLFQIQQGKALSKKTRMGKSPRPFLRTANVLWGQLDLATLDTMDFTDKEVERLSLLPNDLLVCEGGDIGRTAMWRGEIEGCSYQNHVHRLRTSRLDVEPAFYMYWMQAALRLLGLYEGAGNKTTIPNLSKSRLGSFSVPLPPLTEQKAIANILHTVQEAKAATERVISATRELKRSLMKHLFTYGPVSVNEADQALLDETQIGQMPKHWRVIPLGEVSKVSTGTTPSTKKPEYYAGTIPFIKTSEIVNTVIKSANTFVNEKAVQDYRLKIYEPGTVFLAMYGQGKTRGQVGLLDIDAATTQNTAAIVTDDVVEPRYLWAYLMSQYKALRGEGIHGQISHLNLGYVKRLQIPVPPLDEQREICRILSTLDRKIGVEETRRQTLDILFKTFLHNLMTGRVRVHDLDLSEVGELV